MGAQAGGRGPGRTGGLLAELDQEVDPDPAHQQHERQNHQHYGEELADRRDLQSGVILREYPPNAEDTRERTAGQAEARQRTETLPGFWNVRARWGRGPACARTRSWV